MPYDHEPDYRPAPSGGGNTVKIVLIIVGGIVLVVAIACGGLVYVGSIFVARMSRTVEEVAASFKEEFGHILRSNEAATRFMEDVDAGELDAAYGRTTEEFKKRHDRKAFEETVRKNGLVGAQTPPGEVPGQPVGAQVAGKRENRFIFRRRTADGRTVSLTVDVEAAGEDEWRVKDWRVADHGREGRDVEKEADAPQPPRR
jgi:hypothetical protein